MAVALTTVRTSMSACPIGEPRTVASGVLGARCRLLTAAMCASRLRIVRGGVWLRGCNMADLSDKQKSREAVQASYFCVRLYLDSDDYDCSEVLAKICDTDQWAYATHDQDVKADGSLDKPHVHAVFRNLTDDGSGSPMTIGHVAKVLGISSSNIQAGRNENENRGFKGCVRYLIHDTVAAKKKNKFLYSRDIISANFDLDSVFGVNCNVHNEIMNYILEVHPSNFTSLYRWVIKNGFIKEFLRSQYAWVRVMDEVKRNEV